MMSVLTAGEPSQKRIRIVTDGRPGNRNQALGLAEAIARLRPFQIDENVVAPASPWRALPPALVPSFVARLDGQPADILIGCGRASVAYCASAPDGFRIQIMDPKMSSARFDMIVAPRHDNLDGENVILIDGAPNRITPALLQHEIEKCAALFAGLSRPLVAGLIGGPNRTIDFSREDFDSILGGLDAIRSAGAGLVVTASRRTPRALCDEIRNRLAGPGAYFFDPASDGAANPYPAMLGAADAAFATPDSVNMIGEAATAGLPVMLARMGTARASKFAAFISSLADNFGVVRPFNGGIEIWTPRPFAETDRAAAALLHRFDAR